MSEKSSPRPPRRSGGRPRKEPEEKRKAWFPLRATDEERTEIQRRADEQRQPVGVYVRRVAYRGWTRNTAAVDTIVHATAAIEAQIRALEECNDGLDEAAITSIRDAVRTLRQLIPRL